MIGPSCDLDTAVADALFGDTALDDTALDDMAGDDMAGDDDEAGAVLDVDEALPGAEIGAPSTSPMGVLVAGAELALAADLDEPGTSGASIELIGVREIVGSSGERTGEGESAIEADSR